MPSKKCTRETALRLHMIQDTYDVVRPELVQVLIKTIKQGPVVYHTALPHEFLVSALMVGFKGRLRHDYLQAVYYIVFFVDLNKARPVDLRMLDHFELFDKSGAIGHIDKP